MVQLDRAIADSDAPRVEVLEVVGVIVVEPLSQLLGAPRSVATLLEHRPFRDAVGAAGNLGKLVVQELTGGMGKEHRGG